MINRSKKLSPHFTIGEFVRKGVEPPAAVVKNLTRLAAALEEVRTLMGNKPITVNSGYRTPEHNKAVGGAPNSYHLKGMAADIVVMGMSPKQVQAKLKKWNGGLGAYTTFTHVDIGPERRW